MTVNAGGYLERPAPSGLADVVEVILDKGIVLDAYVRVSLLGVELLTIDARVVVASVDTYLRFAEATNRLDLAERGPRSPADIFKDKIGDTIEHVATNVVESKVESGLQRIEEGAEKAGPVAETAVKGAEKVVAKAVEAVVPDEER